MDFLILSLRIIMIIIISMMVGQMWENCVEFRLQRIFFQGKKADNELVKAVSISLSKDANVPYTIRVYTNLTNLHNPKSGILLQQRCPVQQRMPEPIPSG